VTDKIVEIKNRLQAITPGKWQNVGGYSVMVVLDKLRAAEVARTIPPGKDNFDAAEQGETETRWKEDCDFIVNAPDDMRLLLKQNSRMRQALKKIGVACIDYRKGEMAHEAIQRIEDIIEKESA
jgi:hypothetical protein